MRKILILLLVVFVLFLTVACGNNTDSDDITQDAKKEETTQIKDTETSTQNEIPNDEQTDIDNITQETKDEGTTQTKNTGNEKTTQTKNTETVFQGVSPYNEQYEIWDISTEVFSDDILKELGADGFSGTDVEIAQQIYDWQVTHMDFAGPTDSYTDAGYGSRWNFMIPGIYPASKRINNKTSDGKIYGICSDFAYIYTAIANAYDLQVRVTTLPLEKHEELTGSLPVEVQDEESFRGLGREEYDLLNVVLKENNINLTYDQVHRAIQGISTIDGHIQGMHSRVEVFLDGKWIAFDATRAFPDFSQNEDYRNDDNYVLQNWDGIYNPIRLYAPSFQDSSVPNSPIDFDGLIEYFSYGSQVVYTGIKDDIGNENRAKDFDSFVRGDALLPYFTDMQKFIEFLHLKESDVAGEDYEEIMQDFYEGTGRYFNIIADFLIYGDEEMDAKVYIRQYNGITGDNMTVEEFNEYVK